MIKVDVERVGKTFVVVCRLASISQNIFVMVEHKPAHNYFVENCNGHYKHYFVAEDVSIPSDHIVEIVVGYNTCPWAYIKVDGRTARRVKV